MTKATINSSEVYYEPSEAAYVASLTTVWGGRDVALTEQQVKDYQCDPDGFAAAHFGLTREEYQEWIACRGDALCSGKTKAGKPCARTLPGGSQLGAEEWKARHRSEYCTTHGRA